MKTPADPWLKNRQRITVDDLKPGCCFGSGDSSDVAWRIKSIAPGDRMLTATCVAHYNKDHVGKEWSATYTEFFRWVHHRVTITPARNHKGEEVVRIDVCS